MKNIVTLLLLALCWTVSGCEDTDLRMASRAGLDAVRAVTLDDEDVKALAADAARQYDRKHRVAPLNDPYARRLARLTAPYRSHRGGEYDFKVYLSPAVNAFAMADGTVRVYSGLMDMMNDQELLFVMGHEMGHVAERHIKKKMMLAYAGSALRKAIASQQNQAGDLARSALGAFAEQLAGAQFSQHEEREADDYGVMVLGEAGLDKGPAISALNKLATLGGEHTFLSSHPAPEARARRLATGEDAPDGGEGPSLIGRVYGWIKGLIGWVLARVQLNG